MNSESQQEPCWFTLSTDDVCAALNSSPDGLTSDEGARRLEKYGPNQLQSEYHVSPWSILLSQLNNILIIILLAATVFSAFVGHEVEAIAIAVIVLFAVLLGFFQEYRAERAIEALSKMAAPMATALRDGAEATVAAHELVPGDVVLLKAGDRVPADTRVLESINLKAEESALTGESLAVLKQTKRLEDDDAAVGDRTNMLFAGTAISYGRGRAIVVATGMETEFGKIAGMLQSVETGSTPLQKNLDKVGRRLAIAGLIVVILIVVLGLLREDSLRAFMERVGGGELFALWQMVTSDAFVQIVIFGIALAVAVVPEALPAVVTISLAIGLRRMARRNALVRRLPAVETLGCTSVICTDKTGTLTKDEMTARRVFVGGQEWEISGAGYDPHGEFSQNGQPVEPPEVVRRLLEAAVLASDATLDQIVGDDSGTPRWNIKGDPTEGALVVAAAKAGLQKKQLDEQFPRVDEIPFTSESKRMTTLHKTSDGLVADAKGAPEVIVASCARQVTAGGDVTNLDDEQRQAILDAADRMADEALRVLGLACRTTEDREHAEQEMTFLGLVGMIDPPRPEAKQAVQACQRAGIRPVMITGDHPTTAKAIARELGILRDGRAITGAELDDISDEDFRRQINEIDVYARVSPEHKLRVVTMLQRSGQVAAMTGDGVNDAPALKKADIGIAMGITGTDVTKEAAAMTLTDDNFASIVAAIEEGRIVFGNIKKYLMYLLSSNIGEIGLMAGASLVGLPMPLTAVQLLYVNLATDGFPALALAVDPPEPDLMKQKPRDPETGVFTRPVVVLMLVGGIWSAAVNLGLFAWAMQTDRPLNESMSMTFVSLVLIQFFKAYNFRSDHLSVLHRPFANKWLNLAIVWELILLMVILYVPLLQQPFSTHPLSAMDWLIVALVSCTISPVLELTKWVLRRVGHDAPA